jgi:predicted signal transduction protein with EAL and GGDEF domain
LSFNTLKIDQIFISGLGQSEAALGMVRAIINLAHLLGMSVVGEGVENSRQARILRELGCDQLQGHYFSRALPVEAIEEFILQHSAQAERRAAGVYQNGLRSADPGQIERRAVATGVAEMIVAFKAGQRDMAIWPAGRV